MSKLAANVKGEMCFVALRGALFFVLCALFSIAALCSSGLGVGFVLVLSIAVLVLVLGSFLKKLMLFFEASLADAFSSIQSIERRSTSRRSWSNIGSGINDLFEYEYEYRCTEYEYE